MAQCNAYVLSYGTDTLTRKNASLGLPASQSPLVNFNEFTGQVADKILSLLCTKDIYYVIVPPDTLQSLGVSVDKPVKNFFDKNFKNGTLLK